SPKYEARGMSMRPSIKLVAAAAVVAAGAGLATVPVGAAAPKAASHLSIKATGPRAQALDALRHLARPTSGAGVLAWHAAQTRARAAIAGAGLTGLTVSGPTGQMAVEMPVAGSGGDDILVLTLPDTRPSSLLLRSGRTGAV